MDFIEPPELDVSFDDIASSVYSGFLCSDSTISGKSKLKLAPNSNSHKLWYQPGVLHLPISLAGKMAALNSFAVFQVILQHVDARLLLESC